METETGIVPPLDQAAAVTTVVLESYSSVATFPEGGGPPPNFNPAEAVPPPPNFHFPAAKVAVEIVQLVPSHSSVCVSPVPAGEAPPNVMPCEVVPFAADASE